MGLAQITGLLTGKGLPSFKNEDVTHSSDIKDSKVTEEDESKDALIDKFTLSERLKTIKHIAKEYDVRSIRSEELGKLQDRLVENGLLTASKPNQIQMVQLAAREYYPSDESSIDLLETMNLYSDKLSLEQSGFRTLKDVNELTSLVRNLDAFHRDYYATKP